MTLLDRPRVCDHERPQEPYWYVDFDADHGAARNEAGWVCGECGTPLGYRPDLDRSHTRDKVFGLLTDAYEGGFVAVSNAEQGDRIIGAVVRRCRDAGVYDQLSILRFLLDDPNLGAESHARYWHDQAERWLREREDDR